MHNIKLFNDCSALQGVLRTAESLGKLNEIEKFNGIATKTSQINKMSEAVKGLTKENALLLLANKKVNIEDQKKILVNAKIITEEEAKTLVITANTTATNADTVATVANTSAKAGNLSITNLLRVAWAKLNAVIHANPFTAFLVVVSALGVAMGKIADRVYNAEKYAKKALDKSAEKVDNVKSEIESLNSELQTTQSRIDELNAKENLTLVEREELEKLKEANAELEREIRLKQSLLAEEQEEANKNAKKYFTTKKDSLEFESSYEGVEIHGEKTDYIGAVEERIDKLQQYADGKIKLAEVTVEAYKDYVESAISDFMEEDDYLVEGLDDGLLDRLNALYEKYDIYTNGKAHVIENTIRDTLAKADFQSASKQLEELGKSGELSVATLSSRFPELIEYLDKAGISAQELYQYIMALSNPDAINYDEVERQFRESLGIRDGEINGASDQKLWNEIKDSFSEDEWQIALDAYLKVRDQYGDHPEGWTVKDWVSNIRNELKNEKLEVNVSFDQAWADSFTSESDAVKELGNTLLDLAEKGRLTKETFNEADSTGYFKNLNISADEAVSKINKLVDEASQLSSMSSQISSIADVLSTKLSDGFVNADTLSGFDAEVRGLESWDRFQEVLGSTTSSYEDCQEAANALATEWVNDSNFLEQLTEQNKEYYKTQLQAMGVENYEEVIAYAQELNSAKEALAQASFNVATATNEEIQALIDAGTYSELAQQQIWALVLAEQTAEGITLDTSNDCQNLLSLAQNAGVTGKAIELLTQLLEIYNNLAAGTYGTNAQVINAVKNQANALKTQLDSILAGGASDTVELDPKIKVSPATKSSAKSAGKETGNAYKDGLKEALSDLESVISGVTGKIDDQISSINEQKSAALESIDAQKEALEEAKDAAIAALEAERDAQLAIIEDQKKALEKQIKAKQDEIDAINEAAEARTREIDLQKAQYELERMQNQRTKLVYSEQKGMHYVQDNKEIASAKEKVDEAKRQIEIANLEKEKELLEDQVELLDERIDAINEYYDNLIEQTEKAYDAQINALEKQRKATETYYESITKNLENTKSKFQELTEILEKAELSAKLKQLGIDEEALLNGSEEEFNKLKDAYINIVTQLNAGNDDVLEALQELSGYDGTAPAMLKESNDKLGTMNDELGTANTEVGNVNASLGETASTTGKVASNVESVSNSLNQMPESGKVSGLGKEFDTLADSIGKVAKALGIGEGDAVSTLFQAMTNLNTLTLGGESEGIIGQFALLKQAITDVIDMIGLSEEQAVGSLMGAITQLNSITLDESIIAQFNNLKEAIDSVTAAISGGGGASSEGEGSGSNSGSKQGGKSGSQGSGGESGGGGNSLTGAIEQMGETAKEVIGEPDAEGDGTVIGEFGSMETAVNDVTAAIGGGDSEGGEGSGNSSEKDDNNLIGSIVDLGETTEEVLGEPSGDGAIGKFEKFNVPIQEADEHVHGISDGLSAIDGKTVECTIKIKVESDGFPAYASGTALGSMNLESKEYTPKYEGNAHVSGTANITGNWGVRKGGRSLVGELGQEIWVHSADGTFETVGDNGPEFINTETGDLIFNHLQTKELLDKGNIVKHGRAYANGSIEYSDGTIIRPNGNVLRPLQPGDRGYDLMKAFEPLVQKMRDGEELFSNAYYDHAKQMEKWTKEITNNTVINNIANNRNIQPSISIGDIHVTCPGVTSQEVMKEVGDALGKQIGHLSQRALQEQPRRY